MHVCMHKPIYVYVCMYQCIRVAYVKGVQIFKATSRYGLDPTSGIVYHRLSVGMDATPFKVPVQKTVLARDFYL